MIVCNVEINIYSSWPKMWTSYKILILNFRLNFIDQFFLINIERNYIDYMNKSYKILMPFQLFENFTKLFGSVILKNNLELHFQFWFLVWPI